MKVHVHIQVGTTTRHAAEIMAMQIEPDELAQMLKKYPYAVGVPAYWANFGSELEPVVKYWPACLIDESS